MKVKKDYLNFTAINSIFNKEKIIFSSILMKYNDENYRQERALVLTDGAIYNVKKTQVQRRIRYDDLEAISVSKSSSEFVLHIRNSYDYRFLSFDHRSEIMETILSILVNEKKLCSVFKIYEVDLINLNSVMTSKFSFKNKKIIRPPEKYAKLMDLDEFKTKTNQDTERTTNLRKRTTVLYHKEKKDNSEICIEDFELLKILGKGAFGKVILAQKKDNKQVYAIKMLVKKYILEQDQLDHTKAEKMILTHINHPFLVGLDYAFQTDEKLYFVLQFMKGGELFQHLKRAKRFSEYQAKFYAAAIILGLGHLHNKNFIYRDLKLENLLLDEKGYAKLTDFGLAKNLRNTEIAKTFCGTPEYLAPEIILEKGSNRPADWWSLGILVYEMLFGIPPFYSKDQQEMYRKTLLQPLKFSSKIIISPEAKDLIAGLLVKAPSKRLGAIADSLEVMSHPWFKDFDWRKLLDKSLIPQYNPLDSEWEGNFDPGFTNEPAKDSICLEDPALFKNYEKDFDIFNDNENVKDETEIKAKEPENRQLNNLDSIFLKETEMGSLGIKIKETILKEILERKSSKNDKLIETKKCDKKLNFSEDNLQRTPDTLSNNSQVNFNNKNHSKRNSKLSFENKNSFDISDSQLKDLEMAFCKQFD